MRRATQIIRSQKGFTLLEAMVAMVVFSVGLLGLGALQMAGMNTTQSALYQSIATHMAYDMADRIRSNPAGAKASDYDDIPTGIPGANPPCRSTVCSAKEIAQRDNYQWAVNLRDMLPGGVGTVLGDGTTFTITVMWDNAQNGATGTNCNPSDPNDLKCSRLTIVP
jgi:type IV pilus assembly protein PilV